MITAQDIEFGNVVRITGSEIFGSVIATYTDRVEINWSDGAQSVERFPITGIEFF